MSQVKDVHSYFYTYIKPIAPFLSIYKMRTGRHAIQRLTDNRFIIYNYTNKETLMWMQGFIDSHKVFNEGKNGNN